MCQNTDIPRNFIAFNDDFFANYTFRNSNLCLKKDEFLFVLQQADVLPVHTRQKKTIKDIDRWISSPICPKFMKC